MTTTPEMRQGRDLAVPTSTNQLLSSNFVDTVTRLSTLPATQGGLMPAPASVLPMGDESALFDARPGPRIRPWRYLVIEQEEAEDAEGGDAPAEYFISGRFDDRERAVDATDRFSFFSPEIGVWDNHDGSWLVEPDWADEVDMTAEGWARTDVVLSGDQRG